jgi:hypothetical protein
MPPPPIAAAIALALGAGVLFVFRRMSERRALSEGNEKLVDPKSGPTKSK